MSEAAKQKGISANVIVREVMSLGSDAGSDLPEESTSEADQKRSALLKKFSPNTIKSILELLCDESVSSLHCITVLKSKLNLKKLDLFSSSRALAHVSNLC